MLVTACTQFGETTSQTPVATQPASAPQRGAAIPPELQNIFTNAPYETSQPLTKQYPRVAFTVLSSPADHSQIAEAQVSGSSQAASGCWVLSATIWYKEVASRETGPFTICVPAILSGTKGMALNGYNNWALAGQSMSNISPGDPSTGSSRTNGPIPPDTPFPTGTRYDAYYANTTGANDKYPDGASEEGRMWAATLYKMGFYWQNTSDRRIWVYKYVPVEG
jgi:hypothetical protein